MPQAHDTVYVQAGIGAHSKQLSLVPSEIIDEPLSQFLRTDRISQALRRKPGEGHEALKLVNVGGKPVEASLANVKKFFGVDPIAQASDSAYFLFRNTLLLAQSNDNSKHPIAGAERGEMAKTVMIVEDNELNMKLFHDLLESRGYDTIQTRNGLEALDLAREHRPDLILMDIQLPEVSGLVVTKWLKEDDDLAHIPVIAVTAFAMKGDEERILSGGCEGYISKPISVPHFLETIEGYIGKA